MADPIAPEPPLEVLMLGPESGVPSGSPLLAAAAARTASSLSPVSPPVRAERWLSVVHLLILFAFAGLVIYFVSLVWRDTDRPSDAKTASPVLPAVHASIVHPEALLPLHPVKHVPASDTNEILEPAVAPVPGAEEPIPVSSRPEPVPPPPARPPADPPEKGP
ncbi:MAG TPA: hypothetical protein VKW04_17030, partial [Planctomycetota bacterium]|nr:hypothetical protein [Planctomycetota bacterium]